MTLNKQTTKRHLNPLPQTNWWMHYTYMCRGSLTCRGPKQMAEILQISYVPRSNVKLTRYFIYLFLVLKVSLIHASVTSNHGPRTILSPVPFLARKAKWSVHRNFTSVLIPWSHQATGPVRLDASAYLWFGWISRRTPRVSRAMPILASCGPRTGIFSVFITYGTRTGPVHDPQGCRTAPLRIRNGIDTTIIGKNPARAAYGSLTVPARYGLDISY